MVDQRLQKNKKFADKNDRIDEAGVLLVLNKITLSEFLNRMVYEKEGICVDLEPIDDIFDINEYQSTSDDDQIIPDEEDQTDQNDFLCIICQERAPNMGLIPCKHLKCCNICVLVLKGPVI